MANNGLDKLVTGMAFGAAVGVAIGLLVAPKPGSETRRFVRQRTAEYAGPIRERVSSLRRRNNQDSGADEAATEVPRDE